MTTGFMLGGFEFSPAQKGQLIHRGLPENVVVELQSELDTIKSFETTQPSTRRQMIDQIEAIAAAFKAAEESIGAANDGTITNLEPRVIGITNILLRELKHALAAYRDGIEQMQASLERAPGPRRGPETEFATRVASGIKTILERAGVALNDDEKGTLTFTITVAFEALGIAKGEPRQYAAKVLAGT